MIWSQSKQYLPEPFEKEAELEDAILEVQNTLFGPTRIYLDAKKKIGSKGRKKNIPDGYLIDLTSHKKPILYVVENELSVHEPLKHVAVQVLEFALSFESAPQRVKEVVKSALQDVPEKWDICAQYAQDNGYENIDFLLEKMVFESDAFNALVIIDEMSEELETVLISKFRFPVEIISLRRYKSADGEHAYEFIPFLNDVVDLSQSQTNRPSQELALLDVTEIDTIVVPAQEDTFNETFIGENRWYAIRIHSSMIPKIKYVAVYQISPISAITHIASVISIQQWQDTNKYVVNFDGAAKEIKHIKRTAKGRGTAPQAPRYTSMERLKAAKNLSEVF